MLSSSSVTHTLAPSVLWLEPGARTHIPTSPSKRRHLGHRRVGFDEDALRTAEKHESNPSTTRRSKYRTTIDLRSASGWTRWNLDLFNAEFEKDKYTNLRSFLGEDAYGMDSRLEAVVKKVLEGSKQVTNEELQRWYEDETVIQSWSRYLSVEYFPR